MLLICYLVVLIFLINIVFGFKKYRSNHKYFRKNKKIANSSSHSNQVILMVPVYHEEKIIESSIDYFKQIAKKLNIVVYFITTEKEGPTSSNITHILTSNKLNESIKLIHYPHVAGNKASQLNYALELVIKNLDFNKNQYVGVFDADSRPDMDGIKYVMRDLESPSSYQMPSIYSTNFSEVGYLQKANAISQTAWTFNFEVPRILKNYKKSKTDRLMYFIGHGLFIKLDREKPDIFPDNVVSEDIILGYQHSFKNKIAKLIPFFDYCSVPISHLDKISQHAKWFSGETALYKTMLDSIKKGSMNKYKAIILTTERYYLIFQWSLGSLVIIIAMLFTLLNANYLIFAVFLIELIVYLYVIYKQTNIFFKSSLVIYLSMIIYFITHSFGPIYAAFVSFKSLFKREHYVFAKTRR